MRKKQHLPSIAWLLLIVSFLLLPLNEAAASFSDAHTWKNSATGYCLVMEDDAELLSDTEELELMSEMEEITLYGNAAFKSVSYNSSSASRFAADFYHQMFGQESGVLFLIDMDNREIYLFSDGTIYQTITTAYANTITDNSYRYASDGDYYLCASSAFEQAKALLAGQKIAQPMKYASNALLALILAALVNYYIVRLSSGSRKAGDTEILASASTKFHFANPQRRLTGQTKVYNPPPSSGGSHGGRGGSGHSGGGGGHHGGGGHSGGGGGHRF